MRAFIGIIALAIVLPVFAEPPAKYDPLDIPTRKTVYDDFTVMDAKRKREIPIRVYLPDGKQSAPVVLFSHGLGGSKEGSSYLGKHWSARGYVAVFLQHPGSDTSVWKDVPLKDRLTALNKAAGGENFQLRVADVPAVLDQLQLWNDDKAHALAGRMNLKQVGMSGHSFGAVTTQAVSGQQFPLGKSLTDSRIQAAVIMSPSSPRLGDAGRAFGKVGIPWLLMTGTNDVAAIGNIDMKSRLAVYPALPKGSKYELVLNKAEHSAFTDRALPGEREGRNPNHHKVILALSTAFWDAYVRQMPEAKAWLDGDGPRAIMESADQWQRK